MEPFLGQIQAFGFNFAPRGWAFCNGQLLPISQNSALFSLLGTTYGGDGRTTFALPDLRGRVSMQFGAGPGLSSYSLGQKGGVETVTLSTAQMPQHNHSANVAEEPADTDKPAGASIAAATIYKNQNPDSVLNNATIGMNGGGQSHENRQPYLILNWCIALQGVFPSRS